MQTIIKVEHPERISALKQDFQMTFGTVPQRFFRHPGGRRSAGIIRIISGAVYWQRR